MFVNMVLLYGTGLILETLTNFVGKILINFIIEHSNNDSAQPNKELCYKKKTYLF